MILLIIGVGMLNFLLPAPLNSIMFLLIPREIELGKVGKPTLNSIMFLLIRSLYEIYNLRIRRL